MQRKIFTCAVAALVLAVVGLTGCKTTRNGKNNPNPGGGGDVGSVPGIGHGSDLSVADRVGAEGWQRAPFQSDIVYFDYDSARVRPSEVSKLEAVAAYLKGHAGKLVIEGNADERGTAEYNRSLGEKRALACRDELVRLGASADRISTVSYGKEKPSVVGHDEAAWAKNRRCEFVLAGQ